MGTRENLSRGAILIVVLGVLMVLSLLATTFATLQNVERSITRNYLDDVRAKLLATSGVEYAVSEIRNFASQGFFSTGGLSKAWIYWGDDVAESGTNPALTSVPIEWAKNPSWATENENPQDPTNGTVTPRLIKVKRADGSIVGVGFTNAFESGTYGPKGDVYALKVTDMSGMIYVNDGVYLYGGNNSSVSRNLRRVLNNLGKHPSVGVPDLGDLIVTNRPAEGYRSKEELKKAVNGDEGAYNKFKDYVTVYAWVDKNVVMPVPLSAAMVNTGAYTLPGTPPWPTSVPLDPYYRTAVPGSWNTLNKIYRRGRGADWNAKVHYSEDGVSPGAGGVDVPPYQALMWHQSGLAFSNPHHNAVYALDELFPSYIEVGWRAPVNVNTASEPVLMALLADVSGFFLVERRRFAPYAGSPPNFSCAGPGYGGAPLSFTVPQKYYTWEYNAYTYDAQGGGGDEIGYLYQTAPLTGPGSGTANGVSAQAIANHIMACRSKSSYGGINYASVPFGGPFKTWAQFNLFLDDLVQKGVIVDNRPIFTDYGGWNNTPSVSAAQQKFAAQALADGLKANFNPNLHLNETNPDANLYLRVDKTDLIVNSTEFCFTSMGYYEIESLGRVLAPQEGLGYSAEISSGNKIVAEKKVVAAVKVFDVYRESTQRHFYAGELSPRSGVTNVETNNNMSLEIGPEPDNGPLVYNDKFQGYTFTLNPTIDGYAGYIGGNPISTGWGYEYDGYLALPTLGGFDWATTIPAKKGSGNKLAKLGQAVVTPAGTSTSQEGMGATIHSHFALDHRAHYHHSATVYNHPAFREECGSAILPTIDLPPKDTFDTTYTWGPLKNLPRRERAVNFGDRRADLPVPPAAPYNPTYNSRHRLARSFRLPPGPMASGGTGATLLPQLPAYEPSDLHVDGVYSERHSGVAYWIDNNVSFSSLGGVLSFWVKPSFFPEHSGKMRKFIGNRRWHAKNFAHRNPTPALDMIFAPAHDAPANAMSGGENMWAWYLGNPKSGWDDEPVEYYAAKGLWPLRPMSLMTSFRESCFDGSLADVLYEGPWMEFENYCNTPTLNHRLHPGETAKPNYLDHHKWMHVVEYWKWNKSGGINHTVNHELKTYVNGQLLPKTSYKGSGPTWAGSIFSTAATTPYFAIHSWGEKADGTPVWGWPTAAAVRWRANTLTLGECSYHGFPSVVQLENPPQADAKIVTSGSGQTVQGFARNYSADATFDEFYLWKGNGQANLPNALSGWQQGRYYKPAAGAYSDTSFLSGPINLNQVSPVRYLPPLSGVTPPATTVASTTTAASVALASPKRRLMGVSWTWYAESYAPTGVALTPIMVDYQNASAPVALTQTLPCVRVFVLADGVQFPVGNAEGYTNDGFSAIVGSDGKPYGLTDPSDIRYRVRFEIQNLGFSSTLLATPVFDDITFYYDQGEIEYLMFAVRNST